MYIQELAEPQLLVVYPGRFQPFHKGHHAVYDWLCGKFGRNNVYIATSNKTDGDKSPFTFSEKSYFMQLTGVPADRIVQATQPYQIDSVLSGGNITVANPKNTVVIFAVSQKDMSENPRFASWTKKDGSPGYFQPLGDIKDAKPMQEHGYILTVPTFDFNVMGQPMRSGTELRKLYSKADQQQRQAIIKDLFGKYTREAEQIMNNKIPTAQQQVAEGQLEFNTPDPVVVIQDLKGNILDTVNLSVAAQKYRLGSPQNIKNQLAHQNYTKIGNYMVVSPMSGQPQDKTTQRMAEETAGVGVVKGGKDPRYVMATTGDQNDVTAKTPMKNLRAFNLAEQDREPYQQAIDRYQDQVLSVIQDHINEYDRLVSRTKDPVLKKAYSEKLAKYRNEYNRIRRL